MLLTSGSMHQTWQVMQPLPTDGTKLGLAAVQTVSI